MRVPVLLFASYAEALGGPDLVVDVPEPVTVAGVLRAVLALPGAATLPPAPLVAVNQAYARAHTVIGAGDEVALIPPVAGG